MAHSGIGRAVAAVFTGGFSEAARAGKNALSPKIPKVCGVGGPPGREDPAIALAKERLRLQEKRRRGRRASILTGPSGVAQSSELGGIKRINALGSSADQ